MVIYVGRIGTCDIDYVAKVFISKTYSYTCIHVSTTATIDKCVLSSAVGIIKGRICTAYLTPPLLLYYLFINILAYNHCPDGSNAGILLRYD